MLSALVFCLSYSQVEWFALLCWAVHCHPVLSVLCCAMLCSIIKNYLNNIVFVVLLQDFLNNEDVNTNTNGFHKQHECSDNIRFLCVLVELSVRRSAVGCCCCCFFFILFLLLSSSLNAIHVVCFWQSFWLKFNWNREKKWVLQIKSHRNEKHIGKAYYYNDRTFTFLLRRQQWPHQMEMRTKWGFSVSLKLCVECRDWISSACVCLYTYMYIENPQSL